MLKVGDKAINFVLKDKDNNDVELNSFLGKKVVLYFYPKDNTPGCSREAQDFASLNEQFKDKNAVIIGISKDSVASHQKFADKYNLPFILLADTELNAIKAYDVWQEKSMCGKKYMGVVRTTFVIDEQGTIKQIYDKVKVDGHANKVYECVLNI